jgi:hypothetical protein
VLDVVRHDAVLVGRPTSEPVIAFTWTNTYAMPNTQISFNMAKELWDLSAYFSGETLQPDMYCDTNHSMEFTEKELMDIINQWKKIENSMRILTSVNI